MTYEEALRTIPAPGTGCHPYLMTVANIGVLSGYDDARIVADIAAAIPPGRRKVTDREIHDAVKKARETATGTGAQPTRGYSWEDALPDLRFITPVAEASSQPEEHVQCPDSWDGRTDFRRYIRALFRDNEKPMICTRAFKSDDGSWRIADKGNAQYTVQQYLDILDKYIGPFGGTALEMAIGGWTEAGAWVRVNPMDGLGATDANVTAYRNALVECDTMDIDSQLAVIRKLQLPCAAITYSGGKSIHAVVKVDATDIRDYKERYAFLVKYCKLNGLDIDKGNCNPSRFTRLAGVTRGDKKQFLIDTNCGLPNWDAWVDFISAQNDDLPEIETADAWIDARPPLAPCVIDNILRRQHKLLVTGPSKAGKSYLLMELATALATGGSWLGFHCARHRVLYVNLELDKASCANRFIDIWSRTGAPAKGMLDVWNLRGNAVSIDKLAPNLIRRTKDKNFGAIIIDPLYKVQIGDENSAGDMAKFYNSFDRIATATGAAVILCHHHSKGAQGAKKAQDRASGSGVFARDPDALLDLIELELSDNARKALSDAWATSTLQEELDKAWPEWRHIVPQDDQLVLQKLKEHACSKMQIEDVEFAVQNAETAAENATLWRIDGILREFPPFHPVRVWFRWPVHELDTTGIAEDALADGEKPSRDMRQRNAADRRTLMLDEIMRAYEELAKDGATVTTKDMAETLGLKPNTIARRINQFSKALGLKNKKGKITREESDGNSF